MGMMKDAYKTAGEIYFDQLSKNNPKEFEKLKLVSVEQSIVVEGAHDRAQEVLGALGVTYQSVSAAELCGIDLPLDKPVFINCAGTLNRPDVERLRSFVRTGGTLVTTDWALTNFVQHTFPGFVEYNGRSTGDDVVTVELTEVGKALLPDTVGANDEPRWWLESASHPIRVLDRDNVEVLIRSDEMRKKYGEDAIVVRFKYGEGVVYHMVSHIYLQRAEDRNARQQQNASEFVKAKGTALGEVTLKHDQTVGEMESAYLSVGLIIHILTQAAEHRKVA